MRENIKVRKLTFDNVKRARALAPITICGGKDRQPDVSWRVRRANGPSQGRLLVALDAARSSPYNPRNELAKGRGNAQFY
jgi:hypothetical protein